MLEGMCDGGDEGWEIEEFEEDGGLGLRGLMLYKLFLEEEEEV